MGRVGIGFGGGRRVNGLEEVVHAHRTQGLGSDVVFVIVVVVVVVGFGIVSVVLEIGEDGRERTYRRLAWQIRIRRDQLRRRHAGAGFLGAPSSDFSLLSCLSLSL